MRCALFPDPHYCTTWQLGTRLHWVYWWALNCIHDDIFHTAHSIIAILILFFLSGNFFTDCLRFHVHSSSPGTFITFSCIWRKHIIILTTQQPSEAFLVGCQWCYVLPRVANDHLAQIAKFIYLQIVQHQVYRISQQPYDNQLTHTDHEFKSWSSI